jgi:hypothetical protein
LAISASAGLKSASPEPSMTFVEDSARCENMTQHGRCVFVANGQMQAHQVRDFLEASGVTSVLRGESLTKTHGLTLNGLGRVEVLVTEADEEPARALLASAEAGEFRLDEDDDVQSSS